MVLRKTIIPFLAAGLMLTGLVAGTGFADEDHRERGERHSRYMPKVAENATYKQECSSCHFLYLPGLLPARSWEAVMNNSDKHFGENLGLDENTKKEITSFLKNNSAERTDTEWSNKIMRSVGSATPERITEVPWIKKEHRRIKPEVFQRPSIGSFSNCGACHTQGAQGNFEEDAVSIPKK
ncbi:MAG: diheme cytochrome c [Deltaproteobacteria bacterium]|nr:diheme cytochrome c [Deltaproteobacteria bacterium]